MPSAPLTMSDPAPSERATWTSPSENCTQSASRVMDAGDAQDAEELTSRTDESAEFVSRTAAPNSALEPVAVGEPGTGSAAGSVAGPSAVAMPWMSTATSASRAAI